MLVLFDIDATLLKTNRAGVYAMHEAARELFHPDFLLDGVEFGGSLDPLIMRRLLMRNGLAPDTDKILAWRRLYAERLFQRLETPGAGRALPGVHEILEKLERTRGVMLGILTGNYPETGAAKLRASGLHPDRFLLKLFATDSPFDPPQREHLPAVALRRYTALRGRIARPEEVVIIGDTPNDVSCALANECWVMGVATGTFSETELRASGAHDVRADLSDTDDIVAWIMSRSEAAPKAALR